MPRRRKSHYGQGSVYESPPGSGRWFAEVFDGHGKSVRRRANSRDEAEAKRQELIRRRDGGLNVQGAAQTLETFVNVWWERAVKEKGLAPKTLDDYRKTIARYLLPDWGNHRLEEFEQHVTLVLEMQATLRRLYGPATAQRVIAKLSMLFNAAVRWNIMRVNPVMLVREDLLVYKREETLPLTPEQTIRLLNAVDGHRLGALYHIALTLGLRLGEILGLQWGDIDWQAQTITIAHTVGNMLAICRICAGRMILGNNAGEHGFTSF